MSTDDATWRPRVVPALDHATPADRPVVSRTAAASGWSKAGTPDFDTFFKPTRPVIEVSYFRGATFEAGYLGTEESTDLDTVLAWFAADAPADTTGDPR
jgi:hypothetical protein